MKYQISKKRLMVLIVIFPLTVLLIYGAMSYLFLSYIQKNMKKNEIKTEVKSYEKSFVDIEKERLQEKVNTLTQYIDHYSQKDNHNEQDDIKKFVEISAQNANNLYYRFNKYWKKKNVKKMILATLKDIKYGDDDGYIFIIDSKGNALQHFDKTLEGKNILDLQDDTGKEFIKEFKQVADTTGEGFVGYNWYPANDRTYMTYKTAYIKKLDAYGWFIGAGTYGGSSYNTSDEILNFIRKNALFKDGYFFVIDRNANLLFSPTGKPRLSREELKEFKTTGLHVNKNTIYQVNKIQRYGWYLIGTRNIKNVGNKIKKKTEVISNNIREDDMKKNLLQLGIAWFISILLSLYLSMIIYKEIRSYEKEINKSNDKMMFQSKQALIGELFSMIAHQWRQPINKIASIVALVRFELENDQISKEDIDKSCEEIEDSVEFMSETIDDFRTFYKPTTSTKMVNLKTLITRSIFFLKNSIQKNDIKIIKKLEDIEMELYRNEFLQVMLNLIKNAIDAIGTQGVVIIKLYRENEKVVISVENSGKSIEKDVMKKIFEPYFTTKDESMGLGLYMTKIIVEKHMKGEILVEALRDGTRFTIIL
jgi:signal transduction histidine kinase